jgi:hypothetical protein
MVILVRALDGFALVEPLRSRTVAIFRVVPTRRRRQP